MTSLGEYYKTQETLTFMSYLLDMNQINFIKKQALEVIL